MSELLKYKNLIGSIEVDVSKKILHGKIIGINDLVTYEADNVKDLEKEFKDAVDDYIETCKAIGKEFTKSYNGTFNVRINAELHKKAVIVAMQKATSLNKLVEEAIQSYVKSKENN